MTPKNSNPSKPPPEADFSWEAGEEDREIDMYFDWDFYTTAEDRSLDRMHEMHLRDRAALRAVMNIKLRLHDRLSRQVNQPSPRLPYPLRAHPTKYPKPNTIPVKIVTLTYCRKLNC